MFRVNCIIIALFDKRQLGSHFKTPVRVCSCIYVRVSIRAVSMGYLKPSCVDSKLSYPHI